MTEKILAEIGFRNMGEFIRIIDRGEGLRPRLEVRSRFCVDNGLPWRLPHTHEYPEIAQALANYIGNLAALTSER